MRLRDQIRSVRHTFAGNKDMGLILYNGGSLYLDDGKPVPGQFEETIRNLREVRPTIYLNVPVAFDALVPYLRRDHEFARQFFTHVKVMFYAAAGLSQPHRVEDVAHHGREEARAGEVGLPAPGVTLKLAPLSTKKASIEWATRCATWKRAIPRADFCSMAAWPRTSSSTPAPG